ncbi:MAG: glycosyltransferase, partial [Sedimentisphaerales bacterium]|nr:glycosyltransferase [Sedimentisphaerales bacterium]
MNEQRDDKNLLKWRRRNSYYYQWLEKIYKYSIPEKSKVLHIGCDCGDLLNAVKPSYGVGVDPDAQCIQLAEKRFPHLNFHIQDPHELDLNEKFEYIIISNSLGKWKDIQKVFENIRPLTDDRTRIIITYYNYLWEAILRLGACIGMCRPQAVQNWLPPKDIENLLDLGGFDVVRSADYLMFPKKIFVLSAFCNYFLSILPGFRLLNLINLVIARPVPTSRKDQELSVSVVVPCRNERGNIEGAIRRIPDMGNKTEIIFVDGNSTDGTVDLIERQIAEHPEKNIRLVRQGQGTGKGDAVRKGFAQAQGDILVIQDADLTAPPEDLTKFYNALRDGKGEFINGSRLVYPMEKQAMRMLNLMGNKFFGTLFTWLLGQRFRDTLCGTKMIYKKDYEIIAANRAYFGDFDPFGDFDLIFGAIKQNLKVIEVPITYRARSYG